MAQHCSQLTAARVGYVDSEIPARRMKPFGEVKSNKIIIQAQLQIMIFSDKTHIISKISLWLFTTGGRQDLSSNIEEKFKREGCQSSMAFFNNEPKHRCDTLAIVVSRPIARQRL
jgi:hypothetical protein